MPDNDPTRAPGDEKVEEVQASEPYEFARTDRGAEFRLRPAAARRFTRFAAPAAGLAVGLPVWLASVVALTAAGEPAAVAVGTAAGFLTLGLSVPAAYRYLDRRSRAVLLVSPDGRVTFGGEVLAGAGEAAGVRVWGFASGEDGTAFAVAVELRDGRSKRLPIPGLGFWGRRRGFLDPGAAARFAALVAGALGVPVSK
jgi:hypothetical protein